MVPLFVGVPGGPELLILLLIALVVFGLPVVLLGGGFYLYRVSQPGDQTGEELEALRHEVQALREEVKQLDDQEDEQLDDEK